MWVDFQLKILKSFSNISYIENKFKQSYNPILIRIPQYIVHQMSSANVFNWCTPHTQREREIGHSKIHTIFSVSVYSTKNTCLCQRLRICISSDRHASARASLALREREKIVRIRQSPFLSLSVPRSSRGKVEKISRSYSRAWEKCRRGKCVVPESLLSLPRGEIFWFCFEGSVKKK